MYEDDDSISNMEFRAWLSQPMTTRFRRILIEIFDHQVALLSSEDGKSLDRLKGRAEVLQYIIHPENIQQELK